jgi:MFS transporter, DHA1 family, tetracycline resistance protein
MNGTLSRFTLLFIILIDGLGIGIVYPTLAYYFLESNTTLFTASVGHETRLIYLGLIFAIYPFFMAIGSLKIGQLSDRAGRKKALLLCLTGFCVGFFITVIGILWHMIWLIALGRAIAGLTAGCHVIAQASMADISTGITRAKNMGAVVMASTLGFVIGPAFGGILSSPDILPIFNTATPFILVMFMGLICIGLTHFFFKETFNKASMPTPNINIQQIKLLGNRFIMQLIAVYFLFTMGWNLFFQFAPVYLEEYFHVNSATTGSFMSFVALIFMATIALVVRPLLAHLSLIASLLIGLLLLVISVFIMINIEIFHWFWLAAIPFCIGGGFTYTASLSLFSDAGNDTQQGHIMGIASAVKSSAWTLAPIISGLIVYFDIHWPMIVATFCFGLALLIAYWLKPQDLS